MARTSKKQSFIGIAEIGMQMMKKEKSDSVHYNLHSIFSVVDHYLIAQCLDMSMTSRIDLNEIISNSTSDSKKLANKTMHKIFELHIQDIAEHIMACTEIVYPFTHASEKYWKEFRKIRIIRDNYSFNLYHGNPTSGIEAFIDLGTQIKKVIDNLRPKIFGSYKKSFVDIISELQAVA